MANEINLPLKIGEVAEAKSFQIGFRGAWFRCKIRDITTRRGQVGYVLEYYDFPDEKLRWTQLYRAPPYLVGKAKERKRELMLRPCYPPIYNESQLPPVSQISEVTVIVNGAWKEGDLIDWWSTDCFWSGRIIELLGDDKAKIELHPPPIGEGLPYDILLKDIRPSLDWSPECGWTLPIREGDSSFTRAARIYKPTNHGQETEINPRTSGTSVKLSVSCALGNVPSNDSSELVTKNGDCVDISTRKTSCSGNNSGQNSDEITKKDLGSVRSDTLESSIMDLEKLLSKVKWMKTILESGGSSTDAARPQWKFVDT